MPPLVVIGYIPWKGAGGPDAADGDDGPGEPGVPSRADAGADDWPPPRHPAGTMRGVRESG